MPLNGLISESPGDRKSHAAGAWALSAACANVDGHTLPERKRSQAKITPVAVVKITIMPTPDTGWPG